MANFEIIHDRPNCIGCGACVAICEKFWEMDSDGKSNIINGKRLENGKELLQINEKEFECNKEAAESCPVNVIHLKNIETNEEII